MSQNQQYPTGVYVKGETSRVAQSPADAVALVFDGYVLSDSDRKVDADKVVAPVSDEPKNVKSKTADKS